MFKETTQGIMQGNNTTSISKYSSYTAKIKEIKLGT